MCHELVTLLSIITWTCELSNLSIITWTCELSNLLPHRLVSDFIIKRTCSLKLNMDFLLKLIEI